MREDFQMKMKITKRKRIKKFDENELLKEIIKLITNLVQKTSYKKKFFLFDDADASNVRILFFFNSIIIKNGRN